MAELTNLDSKLAEVIGLAQAAQGATEKVSGLLAGDGDMKAQLRRLHYEAVETESRCIDFVDLLEGKKAAILDAARETKREATEMMRMYLGEDSDELDGFEFLTMAEAGEVGHWSILGQLNEHVGDPRLKSLVDWALPIQERHYETVRECALQLAARREAAPSV